MSTPYISIFNKFNSEVNDPNLFSNLTDEEITELLDIFLSKSKSIYFKSCTKDLTNIKSYDYYSKSFVADGVSNTFIIERYPLDPDINAVKLICKINNIDTTNYNFDVNTLTYTINTTLVKDDVVICGYDFSGQFNETLDLQEEFILAKGMILTWLDRQIYREEKLRDKMTTQDYKTSSPGNLLDKLITLREKTKQELNELLISYSFDEFEGFN